MKTKTQTRTQTQTQTQARTVSADGEEISYLLEKKKMKNIYLRVRPDGSVYVTAPMRAEEDFLDSFVRSRVDFIKKAWKKVKEERGKNILLHDFRDGDTFFLFGREILLRIDRKEGSREKTAFDGKTLTFFADDPSDGEQIKKRWERFMTEQCRSYFPEAAEKMRALLFSRGYAIPTPTLCVRVMRSRWGSCMPKKAVVTLNRRLAEADARCIDYVILHELCHFVHPDHSARFHALMSSLMPDWKERKALLNKSVSLTE